MQVVKIFVAGHPALFVALAGDLAVSVVAVHAAGATGQGDLAQAACCIPLEPGDGAAFVLAGDLSTQCVVAIAAHATVRKLFFYQLAERIPGQLVQAVVGMGDFHQAAAVVVGVVGDVAFGIGLAGDVALSVALVLPLRLAAAHAAHEAVEVAIAGWLAFGREQCLKRPAWS